MRAEVDLYLDRIALARRLTRYTASLSLGAHYDYAYIELDLIKVKGKEDAVRIFALMGEPARCDEPEFQALAARHAAMLESYRGQRWEEARALTAECRQLDGGIGGLYDLYDGRIAEYQAEPPGADWEGIFVATTK